MQNNVVNDQYDDGFYNAIEYCLSILENKEAKYRHISKSQYTKAA